MADFFERSLELHKRSNGKIAVHSKVPLVTIDDLSLAYTPGVAEPCKVIADHPEKARELTIKGNTVAVVTDGSAVLGLGNIGPLAALPVMEGKALLFKEFAGIDAFPICLDTQDVDEIVETIRRIAPVFGGINLEDISSPRCFEVEERLQNLGIPVFHDDQHGTAIVLLAGLINACKVTGRKMEDLKIAINGSGAAGIAIAKMLRCINFDPSVCIPVEDVILCDSRGAISRDRTDLNPVKEELLNFTNKNNVQGDIKDVIKGVDVFIGVSVGGLLNTEDIRRMAPDPIVFAMANPIPEIMPEEAYKANAAVVGTGRSDFPNQVNNVLAFPGIFHGALRAGATRITSKMKLAAAYALADCVDQPRKEKIIPLSLNKSVVGKVSDAVVAATAMTSQ
ncbi:MAG: NADP-dependent malic enzyme [Bacteroidota bacterium]